MSKLFNTLRDVLTPYANKINLHTEEIEEIQGDVSDLDNDLTQTLIIADNTRACLLDYYPKFYRGTIDVSNGKINVNTANRAYSELLSTSNVKLFVSPNFLVYIIYYSANGTFVSSDRWKTGVVNVDQTNPLFRFVVRKDSISDFQGVTNNGVIRISGSDGTIEASVTKNVAVNNAYFCKIFAGSLDIANGNLNSIAVNRAVTELLSNDFTHVKADDGYSYYIVCYDESYRFLNSIGWKTGITKVPQCAYFRLMLKNNSISDFTNAINDFVSLAINNVVKQNVFTIGQTDNVAEVITEAMQYKDSIVYIEPYEHDCLQEWKDYYGTDYFNNLSSGKGLILKNNVRIVGTSGCKLKLHYTGSNDYVMSDFSLFNNGGGESGYTIENVIFETSKIRYVIHDERSSDSKPYKTRYSRCRFIHDNSESTWQNSCACIGGGLGLHGDVIVEDCIFSTVTSSANMDSLAYHNSAGEGAQNSLVIKNCYCTGDSTIQLASYGKSTLKTKVIVANCSVGSPMKILDWTGGTPNFDIYQIGNVVRGAST